MLLGLDRLERAVGEYGVVAPDREQFGLPVSGLVIMSRTRRAISRAVSGAGMWPRRQYAVNAVYSTSATSASETQQPSWSSHSARG
jgi:hypothetical protein